MPDNGTKRKKRPPPKRKKRPPSKPKPKAPAKPKRSPVHQTDGRSVATLKSEATQEALAVVGDQVRGPGRGFAWIRQLAGLYYISNKSNVSLEEMSNTEPYSQVSRGTLDKWCNEDQWVNKRKAFFAEVKARMEDQLATSLAREQVKALNLVESQLAEVSRKLREEVIPTNSYESMVAAQIRLIQLGEDLREKIAKEVVSQTGPGAAPDSSPVTPVVSEEEARTAAIAIVELRRKQTGEYVPDTPTEGQTENGETLEQNGN